MEHKAKECVVCGSDKLEIIDQKNNGENTFYRYRCKACGEIFSTENENKKRKTIIKRRESKRESDAEEIYNNNRKYVVEIISCKAGRICSGTGIIIGEGYVLSNAHVVYYDELPAEHVICKDEKDNVYELSIVYADADEDIALLHSDKILQKGACFEKGITATGEKVYAIGNTEGQGICIIDGIVSDRERDVFDKKYIVFTAAVSHGNSGCPLFNSSGRVIGIANFIMKDVPSMNYAIPFSRIICFIEEVYNRKKIKIKLKLSN